MIKKTTTLALGLGLTLALLLFSWRGAAGQTVQAGKSLELINQLGGTTDVLYVEGDYAYVNIGQRIVILDVSDPTSPIQAGRSAPLAGWPTGIDVAGDYAYVTMGSAGLQILDVSRKTLPILLGHHDTPGSAEGVYVAGGHAYVADGSEGLRIVSVADKQHPVWVGDYGTTDARAVWADGDYAYVADGADGLRIIDTGDKGAPTLTGHLDPGVYPVKDVYVAGDYAYLANDSGGLRVVSVVQKDAPDLIGTASCGTSAYAEAVHVAGDYAYVACFTSLETLQVFSVADKSNPSKAGGVGINEVYDIQAVGNHAFVASSQYGMFSVDVTQKDSPTPAGVYAWMGNVTDIDVESGYLYATDTVYNLRVFNAVEPTQLVEVGTEHGSSNRVIVAGDYAYVNTWDSPWQANIRIVSIADKDNPVEVGSLGTSNQCPGFDVADDYLYVVDTWWGLCVYSLADKSNPAQVGSYAPSQSVWDVTVEGDYAYLTSFSSLLVVSVADKGQPAEVGSWSWSSSADEVFVQGDYAYVGTGSGLYVVSIADKSHPAEVGSLTGLSIYGLDVDGDYVYASTSEDGLVVIDVADKSHPTEVGRYAVPRASTVRKVGDAVYLACGQKGLYVLREHDAATAHIPPSGGSLTSPDGSVTVQVPPGAISATITLTFTHQSPSFTGELAGADRFFDLTAVYSDTNEPAQVVSGATYTVTVSYPAAGPAIESTLGLYWWDGDAWSTQGLSSSVNTSARVVTAQVGHFSRFAVLGETRRVYLPVVWRVYP